MTILVDDAVDRRVRSVSVIPGRQRWEVGPVLGRKRTAEQLGAWLRSQPGVLSARASSISGRLLITHDPALGSREVAGLVRHAVGEVAEDVQPAVVPASRGAGVGSLARKWWWRGLAPKQVGGLSITYGIGAAALVVRGLLQFPTVRLAAVVAATGVIVYRGWRRSRARQLGTGARSPVKGGLRTILGRHRRAFWIAVAMSALGQLLYLTPLLVIGWMLAVLTRGPTSLLAGLGLAGASSQLWFLSGLTLVAYLGYALVSYATTIRWRDLANTIEHEWRGKVYAVVQRGSLGSLERERTTRLADLLTTDIAQLGRVLSGSAGTIVEIGVTAVVLIGSFLFWAPHLAWIALLPAPAIAAASFYYQERVAPGHAEGGETRRQLTSQLTNNLEASATVKSFGAEDFEIERIERLSQAYRAANHRIDVETTRYSHAVQVFSMSALIGVLLFGGSSVLAGTLSLETYNGLISLPTFLLLRLPEVGSAVEDYERTLAALGRVLELLELPVEPSGTGRPIDVATLQREIVLDGVTFAYPGRAPALRNVSMRLRGRKTTGLVGATGAGKTTVAKLLLRLHEVQSGRVLLDGADIRELRLEDLRRCIGFVAQDAFLFDGSVEDNIRYGTFDAGRDDVMRAARLAEAAAFIEAMPDQYDSMVGERGVALSGGQRQRLSLARAIVKDAPILVLDEATSAVDNETEASIQRALTEFARDRTLVLIAHRLSTIRHADWIYVMGAGGEIVEEGTHVELLARAGVYASLWRLQVGDGERD
ncbi:ATP-binding cassette subfamily B protein [Nocardia tenerifensis]|uniref:ATP-binding cassette subfamily B protein n=1 Tax=Nocardia tenerifensis TaxID=228006 RepID=A0A318JWS4_9NOCA|nr:ABC transporter ATP-binding protein [Nocardia tenerifensis]PXX58086.1 ATP-binding cassette subfamily B protein [Nocardia tenerifensis]